MTNTFPLICLFTCLTVAFLLSGFLYLSFSPFFFYVSLCTLMSLLSFFFYQYHTKSIAFFLNHSPFLSLSFYFLCLCFPQNHIHLRLHISLSLPQPLYVCISPLSPRYIAFSISLLVLHFTLV